MSNVANRFAAPQEVNREGFVTYRRSLEEQALQVLTTNTLTDTFYIAGDKLIEEAVPIFQQMSKQNPELFAKMLVYARNEGLMRSAPILGLVILSKHSPAWFKTAFPCVIQTPNDLKDFVAICHSKQYRGMGRAVKKAVGDWLAGMSEYHAIKYGSDKSDWSLRDILRLVRPKPGDARAQIMFRWLVKGELECEGLPQITCYERAKRAETTHDLLLLIKEGRLPWEVISNHVGQFENKADIWQAMARQMPYFALLRNLRNIWTQTHSDILAAEVAKTISDPERIAKAKVLPFRYVVAYGELPDDIPLRVKRAVNDALEASFVNMPELPGTVCIAPDVSGSMHSPAGTSKLSMVGVAAIFAAALMKAAPDSIVLPFEEDVVRINLNPADSIMTTAQRLTAIGGGGTSLCAPVEELIRRQQKVDMFIGITDNEEWVGRGFLKAWRQYKRTIAPEARAFLLTLVPTRSAPVPETERGVHFIYGWNDTVLQYIARTAAGGDQMETVKAVTFVSARKVEVA